MGLDAVEIVMRTEDEFSIAISDDEAAAARTVRDLFEIVLSKIDTVPACASSQAFYRTRRVLVECLGVSRRSIRPSTRLDSLLPEDNRRQSWCEISERMQLPFPRLQYSPRWKERFLAASLVFASLVVLVTGALDIYLGRSFSLSLLSFLFGCLLWIVIFGLTNSMLLSKASFLRSELPCSTAGDLALTVLTMNQIEFATTATDGGQRLSREAVWLRLVKIICDQMGLVPEDVVPEARFVEDLGVS